MWVGTEEGSWSILLDLGRAPKRRESERRLLSVRRISMDCLVSLKSRVMLMTVEIGMGDKASSCGVNSFLGFQ